MATLNPRSGLRLSDAIGPCAFTLRILDSMLCRHSKQFASCLISEWGSVPLKTLTKAVHLCDTSLAAVAMPIALLTNPLFLSIPLTTLTKGWPGWYVAGWHEYSCSFSWRVSLFPYLCQLCYFDHIVVLAVDRHQWYDGLPENWLRVVYFTPLTLSQLALPSLTRGVATEPWCLHLLAGKLLFRFISCGCNSFKWFMMNLQTIHSILWCSLGLSWPRMQGNRVEVDIFHPSPCVRAHQDIFPNALITASEENRNNMFSPNPRLPLAIWRGAVRTTVIKLCAPEQCAAPYFPLGEIWM